ncbi:MAG TPA: class I SAM-dependent methyltransferase [Ktedonobacteraceae bacterium]|nr:class I SAM-dependent methyltransferase [Ktedonobacteraceae bacterium]
MSERSLREQALTDHGKVYEHWHTRRKRYSHIFESPNTLNAQSSFEQILRDSVPGKRVLEIGCGTGVQALQIFQLGASYVLAMDISHNRIAQARQHEVQGTLDFQVADVAQPIVGTYDVIVGRAVLHHLDYQEVLARIARENLCERGLMLFFEPLGSNVLMRLYQAQSRDAHTPDEHPFERSDLAWLRATFADFTLIPINYLSLPLGAISSFLF